MASALWLLAAEGPVRASQPRTTFHSGGFRADVCKQVYIGGSGDNNNHGVVIVKFFRPGIENFTENGLRVPLQTRLFS